MEIKTEEVTGTIEALKEVLTPMGETVWEAYMRQTVMEGAMQSVIVFTLFLLATYIAYKTRYVIKEYAEEHHSKKDEVSCYGLLIVGYGIIGAGLLNILGRCILKVVNPEYYVIQDIVRSFGL